MDKIVDGKTTSQRIFEEFQRMQADPSDRPSLKAFCERVQISPSNMYHVYPEWAKKVGEWRDGSRTLQKRRSSVTYKKPELASLKVAEVTIDKLRTQLETALSEQDKLCKERDKFKSQAHDIQTIRDQNERLRGVILHFPSVVKKFCDTTRARAILEEIDKVSKRHLNVVDDPDGISD